MAIQMIFCVETNKKADTDSIYIKETIHHWYELNNQIKISKIYMNSKSKYRSTDVLKEIDKKSKDFILGETRVIYCIDTDQYEKNIEHAKEFDDINQFCVEKDYDLIWFCHDVEEVFLDQKVSDSHKVQEASAFRRKRKIEQIQADKLACKEKHACTSNILNILDKYLPRKKLVYQ